MEYPGVGIESPTFWVPMPIFVWFLDARSDAEGLKAPRFCDLPENRPILGTVERFSAPARHIVRSLRALLGVIASMTVTRYTVTRYDQGNTMAAAERMKAMRERRQARGLRELRLVVPDARSKAIRRRIAKQVAGLDRARELAALGWIEAVSEFDRE
jgi:hypothetical protein